mgnify:FL=1
MRENTLSPRKVFFATYTPPRKMDQTLFAACGPRTLRGFFDRLAAALTRTNGRTPPERRYRPGARWSRTSANTQHDTWYTNIRRRTSQQDENDDGYKKQHTRLSKTGCAAITEMHILFKHGFQISAKGRGQLFDVSAGGIHKKVVVFPRTPFLLTEESVILCTAAVDLRNPFLHLRFC